MKQPIETYLREDEKLLWSAQPEEFVPLDKTHKSKFISTVITAVALFVAITIIYILIAAKNGITVMPILIVLVAIFAAMPIFTFFKDSKHLAKNITYAITDQRLLAIRELENAVEYVMIKEAEFRTDEDGHVSLLCGENGRETKNHQIRNRTVLGVSIDEGVCKRFVMYAIPKGEVDKVKALLSNYIKIA